MKKPLIGSHHPHPTGTEKLHRVHPDQRIEVTVHFKTGTASTLGALAAEEGLKVVHGGVDKRSMTLEGSAKQFEQAFVIELSHYLHPNGKTFMSHELELALEEEWHDCVVAILGLDTRPIAKPHWRKNSTAAPQGTFTPQQIAALYSFPPGDGAGQAVGIIELDGGYMLGDLRTYWGTSASNVHSVDVDGGSNSPTGDPDGPDGEVMLDIEVVGALVPAAKIVVYFSPNTDRGFIDAVNTAIHDSVNKPGVISISWGGPENSWSQQALAAWDQVLSSAVIANVTICVASGDNGSSDGENGLHVDFPAAHPHVIGCGGTQLAASNGVIVNEIVWNEESGGASGGGYSTIYAEPSYQQFKRNGHWRGVPDVAGDADPNTGYQVRIDGQDTVIGGTSAVAPLWAALITRINATLGTHVGFINPMLYANESAFRDIVSGTNGAYAASVGWDACTGLGSPIGTKLLASFQQT